MLRSKVKYLMPIKSELNSRLNGKKITRASISSLKLLGCLLALLAISFLAPLAGLPPGRNLILMSMSALGLVLFPMLQRIKVINDERQRIRALSCPVGFLWQKFRCRIGVGVALGLCLVACLSCRVNRQFIYVVTTYSNSGTYTDTCIVNEVRTFFPRTITRTVDFNKRPD